MAKKQSDQVKAVRANYDHKTLKGKVVRKGQWLVTDEAGREKVMDDDEFRAEFQREPSSHGLVKHSGAREERGLARQERRAAADGLTPIQHARPLGLHIGKNGRATVGDLAAIAAGALSPNVLLPALMITDTKTGAIMKRDALDVQADMRPQITALKVDADGNVMGMDLKPEEWPPRQERF